MRIFIFGSNGMLGNYCMTYLYDHYTVVGLTRKDYDINSLSIDTLREFLSKRKITSDDIIINCAGAIPQSAKERSTDNRSYFTINTLFPVILSMLCRQMDIKMIHITTDCVYSGKDGKYNEHSIPDEVNDYGLSKSLGDLADCTVIRTSIIGEEVNNKRSLLEWVVSNKKKEIKGYDNHYWNGVTCLELAKIIHNIIKNNLYWKGTKHIYSNTVSKYELVSMINEIYHLNIVINKVSVDKVDKTLTTIYNPIVTQPLDKQIEELKSYNLTNKLKQIELLQIFL